MNLWAPSCLGIEQAIKLTSNRDELTISTLYLYPFISLNRNYKVNVTAKEKSMIISIKNDQFLRYPLEKFYLWGGKIPKKDDIIKRKNFKVFILETKNGKPTKIKFEFKEEINSKSNLFLIFEGGKIKQWQKK